jgi:hypothetical protein
MYVNVFHKVVANSIILAILDSSFKIFLHHSINTREQDRVSSPHSMIFMCHPLEFEKQLRKWYLLFLSTYIPQVPTFT